MKRPAVRLQNVQVIVAASAGLVILVVTALTWLGWRLLSQEEILERQQMQNRLGQTADRRLAGFLRRIVETEASLSRMGMALPPDALTASTREAGTTLVTLTRDGVVDVQGRDNLLYYPVPPATGTFDPAIFAVAERLEFQAADLKSAATIFTTLSSNKDPQVQAEALLRLARVQGKNRQFDEGIATSGKLVDKPIMMPGGEPYGLVSRLPRIQLLIAFSGRLALSLAAVLVVVSGLAENTGAVTVRRR